MTLDDGARTRPDLVLIMMDQAGARWIDLALATNFVDLPAIRSLYERGIRFDQAYTTNPVCCPARASIATGMMCSTHGVTECGYRLDPTLPTFMKVLQRSGWRTAAFGKLHFVPQLEPVGHRYEEYGFDFVAESEDPRVVGGWLDWVRENHPEFYEKTLATVWMHDRIKLWEGPERESLPQTIDRIRSSFDWEHCGAVGDTSRKFVLPFPAYVSQSTWITNQFVDYVENLDPTESLFAQVSYVQPHDPFCAPAEYIEDVDVEGIPLPLGAEWTDDPYAPRDYFTDPHRLGDQDWRRIRQLYFADLRDLDSQIGRVLGALEDSGRLDNTYVIFTSDHGEMLGDHGFLGKWGRHYDACIRVPFCLMGPGLTPSTSDALVSLIDIAPTFLDLAGADVPTLPEVRYEPAWEAPPRPVTAGRSLVGFGGGQAPSDWRSSVLVESNGSHWSGDSANWVRTIITDRYRYSWCPSGSGEQLFDKDSDPDEQHNLMNDGNHQSTREALRDELMELVVTSQYPPSPRGLYKLGSF